MATTFNNPSCPSLCTYPFSRKGARALQEILLPDMLDLVEEELDRDLEDLQAVPLQNMKYVWAPHANLLTGFLHILYTETKQPFAVRVRCNGTVYVAFL